MFLSSEFMVILLPNTKPCSDPVATAPKKSRMYPQSSGRMKATHRVWENGSDPGSEIVDRLYKRFPCQVPLAKTRRNKGRALSDMVNSQFYYTVTQGNLVGEVEASRGVAIECSYIFKALIKHIGDENNSSKIEDLLRF